MRSDGEYGEAQRIADALRADGAVFLRVFGTSMAPTVPPGSIVHIARAEMISVRPGAIVAYLRSGRIFVHRVISVTDHAGVPRLITRGEALDCNDPAIGSGEWLGVVTAVLPTGKTSVARRGLRHIKRGLRRFLRRAT